jgi:hypothetical protein
LFVLAELRQAAYLHSSPRLGYVILYGATH